MALNITNRFVQGEMSDADTINLVFTDIADYFDPMLGAGHGLHTADFVVGGITGQLLEANMLDSSHMIAELITGTKWVAGAITAAKIRQEAGTILNNHLLQDASLVPGAPLTEEVAAVFCPNWTSGIATEKLVILAGHQDIIVGGYPYWVNSSPRTVVFSSSEIGTASFNDVDKITIFATLTGRDYGINTNRFRGLFIYDKSLTFFRYKFAHTGGGSSALRFSWIAIGRVDLTSWPA